MQLQCPKCGGQFSVGDNTGAGVFTCPHCHATARLPDGTAGGSATQNDRVHPLVWAAIGGGTIAVAALVIGLIFWPSADRPSANVALIAPVKSLEPVEAPKAVANSETQSTQRASPMASEAPKPAEPVAKQQLALDQLSASVPNSKAVPATAPSPTPKEITNAKNSDKPESVSPSELDALIQPSVVKLLVTRDRSEFTVIGSGFIVDVRGFVVTNYHVIEGAKRARVVANDTAEYDVEGVVAFLPGKDLAIVKINPADRHFRPLPIANQQPKRLESVFAFGSPLGLAGSAAPGAVSAIRTGNEVADALGKETYLYDTDAIWIQTTAPISHGNSGGPLVAANGDVIGVNTWCPLNVDRDLQNLNFAIASSYITQLLEKPGAELTPFANLPPSPRLLAANEAEKKAREQAERQARDEAARLVREETERQRTENLVVSQSELNRLTILISQTRDEIAQIEKDGTVLTTTRGQVVAQGLGVFNKGMAMAKQINALERQIAPLNDAINNRMIGGVIYLTGHEDEFAAMRQRRDILSLQYGTAKQQAADLEAQFIALDSQAKDLAGQIQYKAQQRDEKVVQLRQLELNYKQLQQPTKKTTAK